MGKIIPSLYFPDYPYGTPPFTVLIKYSEQNDFQYPFCIADIPAWIFNFFLKLADMNQAETLERKSRFSFSELRKKVAGLREKKIFGFEKTSTNLSLEQTINNYLKTPAEMDAEFSLEMNTGKLLIQEQTDFPDTYGRLVEYKADTNNSYNPDSTPSGYMEENY